MECEGIGPERAEAIAEWFADEDNRALVDELRALGLDFEADEDDRPVEGPLTGTQYVITGTLESFTREEAKAALEALGAKVSDNVSKKTTGVVVGEEPGARSSRRRRRPGVPLLTEADLKAHRGCRRGGPGAARRSAVWAARCARDGPSPTAMVARPTVAAGAPIIGNDRDGRDPLLDEVGALVAAPVTG